MAAASVREWRQSGRVSRGKSVCRKRPREKSSEKFLEAWKLSRAKIEELCRLCRWMHRTILLDSPGGFFKRLLLTQLQHRSRNDLKFKAEGKRSTVLIAVWVARQTFFMACFSVVGGEKWNKDEFYGSKKLSLCAHFWNHKSQRKKHTEETWILQNNCRNISSGFVRNRKFIFIAEWKEGRASAIDPVFWTLHETFLTL